MAVVGSEGAAAAYRPSPSRIASLRKAAVALALLLTAWLAAPALTPAHVEGFSASIAALGMHLADGSLAAFDRLQPLDTEYFGLTKLGAVIGIAALVGPFHLGSDLAFRLLMWSGLAALLAGSAFLVRRWSGARWRFVLPPLLILPGIVESGFIYNDNVPSAGLAALGLCLLYGRGRPALAAAGLLLGFAALTRTDTILACAAAPVILYERFGATRRTVVSLLLVGAAAGLSLLGTLALFHASLLDLFRIGSATVALWNRPPSLRPEIVTLLYYFGLPGLLLTGIGAGILVRRRAWLPLLRLLIGPFLLIGIMSGKLWEIRQLLALTPFVCTLAAVALEAIYQGEENGLRRLLRPGVAALVAMALLGPMTGLRHQDGPRVTSGRVWAIAIWRDWQEGTWRDMATIDRLIAAGEGSPTLAIVPDDWNEDRYLHLRLLDGGYKVAAPAGLTPACRPIADRFVRPGSEVIVVRNHQGFVPYWRQLAGERLERLSFPCLASLGGAPAFWLASSDHAGSLLPGAGAEFGPGADDPRAHSPAGALSYGPIVAIRLDPSRQQALLAGYHREAAALPLEPGQRAGSMEEAIAATGKRLRFPV